MSPERWQKVNEVFQSVIELDPDEQKAYLDKACAEDKSLRQQVESLIVADNEAENFISGNAAEDIAHLLTHKDLPTLTGEKLGHYEIISELGAGGMGKVYLAKDSKLNRPIAVKTLPISYSSHSDYVKRFQTEAKAAANLNHPNVATVYSVEETDDKRFFITMEYVEGKSLGKSIPENGLDLRTFLEWFSALADALAHAHEKGIIHRDIKPNNILITPSGNPKILDFGLARINRTNLTDKEESTLSLTKPGQVLGTPTYMSPEQAEGKSTDHRTDIFSFGIVMYEAISGEKPFKGDSYASIVSKLITEEPKHIESLKSNIPQILSRLIMKCLNKDPRYRYQSMTEVRVLLNEMKSALNSGASLSKASLISSTEKESNYFRPLAYIAFGLLGVLGIFTLWTWFYPNTNNSKEILKFSITSEKGNNVSIVNTKISPDGKKLLFRSTQKKDARLFLRSLDNFEVKPISETKEAESAFFSADGEWIGFATDTDKIQKVPIKGGDPITVCDSCPSNRVSFWGTDGYIYFSSDDGLYRVSANVGKPEKLTSVDKDKNEVRHYQPFLLPSEKHVIFTVSKIDGLELGVLSLDEEKWDYIKEAGEGWYPQYVSTGHLIFVRDKQLMAMPFDLSTAKPTDKPKLIIPGLFSFAPNLRISQNGTLIYIPTILRTQNQLVWVDRTGKTTPAFEQKGDFFAPRISPDGNRVAVVYNKDIWVYNIEDGGRARLTDSGNNEIPIWSVDGKSVLYITKNDNGYGLYKKNADGTGKAEEIHKEKYRFAAFSIHPTEDEILIATRQNTSDILLKPPQGNSLKELFVSKFNEDTPRFSPDGKWIAYFSTDTGKPNIYVHPWDDLSRKIPITKEAGMFPVWSRDGKELFYRSGRKFYSVDINASQGFSASPKKFLFEGKFLTSFDVSSDGKKFLLVRDEHGTLPTKLNIILNWTEELKRKMSDSD